MLCIILSAERWCKPPWVRRDQQPKHDEMARATTFKIAQITKGRLDTMLDAGLTDADKTALRDGTPLKTAKPNRTDDMKKYIQRTCFKQHRELVRV